MNSNCLIVKFQKARNYSELKNGLIIAWEMLVGIKVIRIVINWKKE